MNIVVVRSPKAFRGILKAIFGLRCHIACSLYIEFHSMKWAEEPLQGVECNGADIKQKLPELL